MSSALSSCDMSWNTIACPPESTRSYHLASVSTGVSELSAMCRVLVTVLDDITKSKNTCVCKAARVRGGRASDTCSSTTENPVNDGDRRSAWRGGA